MSPSGDQSQLTVSQEEDAKFTLGELREKILEIVNTIIEKNRVVLVERVFRLARRELGAPRRQIDDVIDDLIREQKIVPGSRITREIILNNKNRKKIYFLLKKFPGLNLNTIKSQLKLGSHSVEWHLEVLLKFGCIQEFRYKGSSLFALGNLHQNMVLLHFFSRKDLIRGIFQALLRQPATLADLERELGIPKQNISYHVNILDDLNLIKKMFKEGSAREKILELSEETRRLLPQILQNS